MINNFVVNVGVDDDHLSVKIDHEVINTTNLSCVLTMFHFLGEIG